MSTIAEGIRVGQAASAQAITQRQIAMILALITSIAGAVAGCLMVIYGGQASDLRDDHVTVITRMEESHAASLIRMEATYDGRVNDLKTLNLRMSESLETCMESRDE